MMRKLYLTLFVSALFFVGCSNDDDDTKVQIEISEDEVTSNSIAISWSALDDAIYYDVSITPDDNEQSVMVSGSTSYTFTDLKAGTEYNIMVQAGSSIESESIIGEGTIAITTETLPEEFVGTWEYSYESYSQIYVFNQDGTGTFTSISSDEPQNIMWSIEDDEIVIKYFNDNGTSYTEIESYSFNEDKNILMIGSTFYFLQNEE